MQWLMEDLLLLMLFGGMVTVLLVGHRNCAGGNGCRGGKRAIRVRSRVGATRPGKDALDRPEWP